MGKVLTDIEAAIRRGGINTFDLSDLIDKWIFSARDRKILKYKLCHRLTYEAIAERMQMSTEQTKRIVKRGATELQYHI